MNKAIMAIMIAVVIYLLGAVGDPKLEEVTTAISLLSMPWITS